MLSSPSGMCDLCRLSLGCVCLNVPGALFSGTYRVASYFSVCAKGVLSMYLFFYLDIY